MRHVNAFQGNSHWMQVESPGPRVVAKLVHVGVVLGQDGDGVALLPDDQPGLLLRGVAQVNAIEL